MQEEVKVSGVPLNEQETHINWMRDEGFASIYSSDSTMITKFDKLCAESPEQYECIEVTTSGKRYLLKDKGLISFRKKKREISEEQRQKASERLKAWRESN